MTTLPSSFKLILVVKSFFSYNQKPEDTIQNTCSSAVSEEAHGRCLNRFIKLLQLKQVKQDGSCLFAIKKSFLGDYSLFLHSKRSSTKSGTGGTKTVKKQALQTERAAGTRYCAVRNNKELSLGEQRAEENNHFQLHAKKPEKLQLRDKIHWRGKPVCMPWPVLSSLFLPFVCLYMMLFDILQVATHIIF